MFKKGILVIAALLLAAAVFAGAGAAGSFVEPDVTVIYTLTGGPRFGWVGSDLGDISGDGVHDFLISDIAATGFAGKVFVYSGADASVLAEQNGNAGSFEALGYSASLAGDVNDDGVPDYTAGAPFGDYAEVYSGADHSLLYHVSGAAGSSYGASVGTAGDVNGDGYDDFLVGADTWGADFSGRVDVYSGMDGSIIRSHVGPAGGSLGTAVGKVGDIDGDSVPDYVLGARTAGKQGRGLAYAHSGATGDVLFTMAPVGLPGEGFPSFATFFASGAGDVTGDGTPDIFIGDYYAERGDVPGTGRAYVFSGRDGQRIRVLNADDKADGFGPGRGIGDIDGDGHGDLIVGAYTDSDGAAEAGKAFLISGKNGRTLREMTGATAGEFLGVDALPVGDLNGDGLPDYLLTGFGVAYVIAGN